MNSRAGLIFRLALSFAVLSGTSASSATLWEQLDTSSLRGGAAGSSQTNSGVPTIIAYSESVPCPPAAGGRKSPSHPRASHRRHLAPRVQRPHRIVHHPAHQRPAHTHARPRLIHTAAPVHTKSCVVLHHDRLTHAGVDATSPGFGLVQTAYEPRLAMPSIDATTAPSSGRSAFADPSLGGGASGGPGSAAAGSTRLVSAAPEPDEWVLMILGVGLSGISLRRRRKSDLSDAGLSRLLADGVGYITTRSNITVTSAPSVSQIRICTSP